MVNLALLNKSRTVQEAWRMQKSKFLTLWRTWLTETSSQLLEILLGLLECFFEITCLSSWNIFVNLILWMWRSWKNYFWDSVMTFWYNMIYASWKGYGLIEHFFKDIKGFKSAILTVFQNGWLEMGIGNSNFWPLIVNTKKNCTLNWYDSATKIFNFSDENKILYIGTSTSSKISLEDQFEFQVNLFTKKNLKKNLWYP